MRKMRGFKAISRVAARRRSAAARVYVHYAGHKRPCAQDASECRARACARLPPAIDARYFLRSALMRDARADAPRHAVLLFLTLMFI